MICGGWIQLIACGPSDLFYSEDENCKQWYFCDPTRNYIVSEDEFSDFINIENKFGISYLYHKNKVPSLDFISEKNNWKNIFGDLRNKYYPLEKKIFFFDHNLFGMINKHLKDPDMTPRVYVFEYQIDAYWGSHWADIKEYHRNKFINSKNKNKNKRKNIRKTKRKNGIQKNQKRSLNSGTNSRTIYEGIHKTVTIIEPVIIKGELTSASIVKLTNWIRKFIPSVKYLGLYSKCKKNWLLEGYHDEASLVLAGQDEVSMRGKLRAHDLVHMDLQFKRVSSDSRKWDYGDKGKNPKKKEYYTFYYKIQNSN